MKNNQKLIYGTGGAFGYQSRARALELIRFAIEKGIYKFDTGSNYANFKAEKLLGYCINNAKIDTNKLEIYTKFGTVKDKNGKFKKDFSVNNCFLTLEKSLINLRRDYVDCYFMHEPPALFTENKSCCEALESLKYQKKIKSWGVVAHNYKLIDSIIHDWQITPEYIMIKCNLGNFYNQKKRIDFLNEKQINVIAGTILGQGSLLKNSFFKINLKNQLFYILRRYLKKESRSDYIYNKALFSKLSKLKPQLAEYAAVAFIIQIHNINAISFSSLRKNGISQIIDMSSKNLSELDKSFLNDFLISKTK